MRSRNLRLFLAGGLLVTVGLALVVSGFASSSPDGLERVAEDKGFLGTARDHLLADGPLADYAVKGVGNERLSTGLSGLIGVLITFGLGWALFAVVRSRRSGGDGGKGAEPGGPGSEPKPTRAPLTVGAGHSHALYLPGTSPLHRARPQCKLVAAFLFVLAVVATPREAFWAFGVYALLLAGLARVAGLPLPTVARRLVIELPFLAFAVFLPLVGQGERVDVLGMALAREGLWAAWNIVAKGTLGVATSVILAATTPVPELLRGLERLRLPAAFTGIAGFMVRYADVIADEVRRMRIARISRGYDPRWIWQARAVAASAGTLFIRSYERGERVYLAMVSRGYAGSMPVLEDLAATRPQWLAALCLPATAALVAATAWGIRP